MAEETWRPLKEAVVGHDDFLEVRRGDYEVPGGKHVEGYWTFRERDSVHIAAVTPDRELLLVRQYRLGPDAFLYECPAGFLEQGETDPLERAKGELREETGYQTERWHSLGVFHETVNRMRKNSYCFLALDARQVAEQKLDSTESVRFERVPLAEVRRMVRDGEITAANTLALLCKALLFMEAL
ncbi:MAG TPA: NUDIX hydrolase [Herpetosiphonaceae bacterium]|nr:NUDIX hydrolase [Herpetosiphonaceae bacterium]